jgi:hypothetical protein
VKKRCWQHSTICGTNESLYLETPDSCDLRW